MYRIAFVLRVYVHVYIPSFYTRYGWWCCFVVVYCKIFVYINYNIYFVIVTFSHKWLLLFMLFHFVFLFYDYACLYCDGYMYAQGGYEGVVYIWCLWMCVEWFCMRWEMVNQKMSIIRIEFQCIRLWIDYVEKIIYLCTKLNRSTLKLNNK